MTVERLTTMLTSQRNGHIPKQVRLTRLVRSMPELMIIVLGMRAAVALWLFLLWSPRPGRAPAIQVVNRHLSFSFCEEPILSRCHNANYDSAADSCFANRAFGAGSGLKVKVSCAQVRSVISTLLLIGLNLYIFAIASNKAWFSPRGVEFAYPVTSKEWSE